MVAINCIFKYNCFYAFLIISCLSVIPIKGYVRSALISLGNNSMNMWMIHTWFCYYLFHNFIYSFEYPLFIFTALTLISYVCSIAIDLLAKPIERQLLTRSEISAKPIL